MVHSWLNLLKLKSEESGMEIILNSSLFSFYLSLLVNHDLCAGIVALHNIDAWREMSGDFGPLS